MLVLDSSIALSWCFEDEATLGTRRLLETLLNDQATVPAIWPVEIANVLALAERRRRIAPAEVAEFIALLQQLSVVIDEETPLRALGATLNLARSEALTAYDASYLELAMRLGVSLATKDVALAAAATRLGVTVVGGD